MGILGEIMIMIAEHQERFNFHLAMAGTLQWDKGIENHKKKNLKKQIKP